jgi:hypothetical protein
VNTDGAKLKGDGIYIGKGKHVLQVLLQHDIDVFSVKRLDARRVSPKAPIAALLALGIGLAILSIKRLALNTLGLTEHVNIMSNEY